MNRKSTKILVIIIIVNAALYGGVLLFDFFTDNRVTLVTEVSLPPLSDKDFLVNLNTASKDELKSLAGISDIMSKRIIDYREAFGGFKSVDEIKNVKGIGNKTFEKIKNKLTV